MITSIHTLIYSDDPAATRAFLRDVVGWPFVEDAGGEPGWLIFATGRSEMGVHPTHTVWEGRTYDASRWISADTVVDTILHVLDLPGDATIPDVTVRPVVPRPGT